jgi:arginase
MSRSLTLIGAPSGAGACGVGQERAPAALREAGLIEALDRAGVALTDFGDGPVVPWRPDRDNPTAQNVDAVVDMVRTTADRVTDLASDRTVMLVMGGDCTVGIGTVAGAQRAFGHVGLLYFDLHSDLNTPASGRDGALDWMGLAHMLAIDGTDPRLAAAGGQTPLLDPGRIVLFGHDRSQSTRFERSQIERPGLSRVAVDEVREDPEGAAHRALGRIAERSERFVIHLDVDVVDFTDAPLSELTSLNVGLKLDEMIRALAVLACGPALVAITLAELNPNNAAADDGLLERFAASFAVAISGSTQRPDAGTEGRGPRVDRGLRRRLTITATGTA